MKKIIFSGVVAPFVLLTCLTSVVQAASFNYSFTWAPINGQPARGGTLSGMLEGTVTAIPNEVAVTSIMGTYTALDGSTSFNLDPTFGVFAFGRPTPTVSFDGTFLGLITSGPTFAGENFELILATITNGATLRNSSAAKVGGIYPVVENQGVGPLNAPFTWSLTEKTDPIPEPASLILFGTGMLGLLAWAHRKKKAATI